MLELRLVPEEATRVAAIRAGAADIAAVGLAARTQVEAGGGRLIFGQEGAAFDILQLGCWEPQIPCRDKRVRQALSYAIDKKAMQKLLGGPEVMQIKGWIVVTPNTIGYSQELDPFPYDPGKARQLLADAGYPNGKGFGKLIINTWVSKSFPLMVESAQLGADSWRRELGLEVEVKVGDETNLLSQSRTTNDLNGQVVWRDNDTRPDASARLRSEYATPALGRRSRSHNDPELVALTEKALGVFDPVEREKALEGVYRRVRDESYHINLGYVNIPWGVGPRIRTWEPYPMVLYASALHTITLK
jgi:ABC-type transport system substrate-binding protein